MVKAQRSHLELKIFPKIGSIAIPIMKEVFTALQTNTLEIIGRKGPVQKKQSLLQQKISLMTQKKRISTFSISQIPISLAQGTTIMMMMIVIMDIKIQMILICRKGIQHLADQDGARRKEILTQPRINLKFQDP